MPHRVTANRAPRSTAGWLLLCATLSAGSAAYAGLAMPEAITSYRMRVRYDPVRHEAQGQATISWINNSGETVPDLQLHLYLNAFRNVKSTYFRESEDADLLRKALEGQWGWLDITRLTLADGSDLTNRIEFIAPDDGNRDDRTVARVVLPRPVAAGARVQFTVEFRERFPRAVDRNGWAKNFLMAGQWFPKLGVYEPAGRRGRTKSGWNCHQVHSLTEYFSEFGDYDVAITVPKAWKLAATGARTQRHENIDGTVTERWQQRGVHDFAWAASPHFVVTERMFRAAHEVSARELEATARQLGRSPEELRLPDVKVTVVAFPEERAATERNFRALFAAIKYYGLWYGPYPYDQFTLLVAPRGADLANGMEYPTFVTGCRSFGLPPAYEWLETTVVHEFGHQYWYGMLASNEFEESWLDEGINSYSEQRVMDLVFGPPVRSYIAGPIWVPGVSWHDLVPGMFGIYGTPNRLSNLQNMRRRFLGLPATDDLVRNGWEYWSDRAYQVNSYQRPAILLATLERMIGSTTWSRVMRAYAESFRFAHPTSRDFLATLNRITGQDWAWYFDQFVWGQRRVDYEVARISNDEIVEGPGVYERNGKQITLSSRDVEKDDREHERREQAAEKKARAAKKKPATDSNVAGKIAARDSTRYRSEVRVRRLGDGFVPVELAVYFSDLSVVRERWDGKYQWARFTYEKTAKVDSAIVDPQEKVLIDTNRLNNFRAAKGKPDAAERWTIHWMLWVQSFLQVLGWFA